MKKYNFGSFSAYGVEHILNYIKLKKTKATEIDNIRPIDNLISNDFGYFGGTGVLWFFSEVIKYQISNIELIFNLWKESLKYNDENYFSHPSLKNEWQAYKKTIERIIEVDNDFKQILLHKISSPYWIELHFFSLEVVKILHQALIYKQLYDNKILGMHKGSSAQTIFKEEGFKMRSSFFEALNNEEICQIEYYNINLLLKKQNKNEFNIKIPKPLISKNELQNFSQEEIIAIISDIGNNYLKNIKKIAERFYFKINCMHQNYETRNEFIDRICAFYKFKRNFQKVEEFIMANNENKKAWTYIFAYDDDEGY